MGVTSSAVAVCTVARGRGCWTDPCGLPPGRTRHHRRAAAHRRRLHGRRHRAHRGPPRRGEHRQRGRATATRIRARRRMTRPDAGSAPRRWASTAVAHDRGAHDAAWPTDRMRRTKRQAAIRLERILGATHTHQRVLLRPARAPAARLQREHPWALAPILPQGRRLLDGHRTQLDAVADELNERPRNAWPSPPQPSSSQSCCCTDRQNSPFGLRDDSERATSPPSPAVQPEASRVLLPLPRWSTRAEDAPAIVVLLLFVHCDSADRVARRYRSCLNAIADAETIRSPSCRSWSTAALLGRVTIAPEAANERR
jgi:hypothetical protein